MDTILIEDIEVHFRVGVPASERAQPQRMLVSVELELDTRAAAATDDLGQTVNYFDLHQNITRLGEGREWKLIETLAEDITRLALAHPQARAASVQVKKFVLPQTRFVAVRISRSKADHSPAPER